MPLAKSIENWLYSVLQPQYLNKQIAYSHIHHFLLAHLKKGHDFRIKTAVHTSIDGYPQLLINLYGVINVDANLGVPVSIWVPWEYPFGVAGVPIVYIIADHSQNWFLRPTNNVDSVGKFYHPYLTEWSSTCINEEMNLFSKFNLTALLDLVASTVSMQVPIYQGSLALPPKPKPQPSSQAHSQESGNSNQQLSSDYLYSRGAVSPSKPPIDIHSQRAREPVHAPHSISHHTSANDAIPSRYATPLPLPLSLPAQDTGVLGSGRTDRFLAVQSSQVQSPPEFSYDHPQKGTPQSYDQLPLSTSRSQNHVSQAREYIRAPPRVPNHQQNLEFLDMTSPQILDLMDSAPKISATTTAQHSRLLEDLATKVNALLPHMPVNMVAADVNIHSNRSNALLSQLSHHHRQAHANSQNLSEISNDLLVRIEAAAALNKTLDMVVAQNTEMPNAICTEPGHSLPLDELIVADSPIITQLYEVVLEIKACKDTIKLLGGSFKGHPELISDKNVRQCVKQARSIGRDLFWLEITKKEILLKIRQE